ncbi:MAG: hypothetical protein H6739_23860 [Alphaproteobacteria bacterium]|nr:hypothetical protein [Alphaproteobacteria bacterium]
MKSWSASRLAIAIALFLGAFSGAAHAGPARPGFVCLKATDLPCARELVDALRDDGERGPAVDLLEARVLFQEGRFAEATERLGDVLPRAGDIDLDDLAGQVPRPTELTAEDAEKTTADLFALALKEEYNFYIATTEIHAEMVETRVGDIVVSYAPGIERILVDETVEILRAAKARVAPLVGGDIPVDVRVEFYADGASFATASTLPLESIQTTGVVAISKWNRLLVTSPRVRGGGYGWKDTVVHEWIHQLVSYHSGDKAPIWLQEGIARSLDSLWREDSYAIPVHGQSLLAGALKSGNWVTFEQMHPSMAFLPSADMAALAYAQVSTMMDHLRRRKGDQALPKVLKLVRDGMDARDAVAEVANGGDFKAFEDDWRAWLARQDLVGERIAAMPTNLDGSVEAIEDDPVLGARKDLANKARLGELMAQRDHHEAALVYYEQAVPEDEPPGPYLVLRQAESLAALGRPQDAVAALQENLRFYPEVSATRRLLGELLLAEGDDAAALPQFARAADLNPFDVAVQQTLVTLYTAAGERGRARRHQGYVDLLYYRDAG